MADKYVVNFHESTTGSRYVSGSKLVISFNCAFWSEARRLFLLPRTLTVTLLDPDGQVVDELTTENDRLGVREAFGWYTGESAVPTIEGDQPRKAVLRLRARFEIAGQPPKQVDLKAPILVVPWGFHETNPSNDWGISGELLILLDFPKHRSTIQTGPGASELVKGVTGPDPKACYLVTRWWVPDRGASFGPEFIRDWNPTTSPTFRGRLSAPGVLKQNTAKLYALVQAFKIVGGRRFDASAPNLVTIAGATAPTVARTAASPINVNKANLDDLMLLPGIGKTRAAQIVAHRKYKSIGELITRARVPASVVSGLIDRISL